MATDRISVRLDPKTIKFLEQIGGEGRGAISRGVARVIEFARDDEATVTFETWLDWKLQRQEADKCKP